MHMTKYDLIFVILAGQPVLDFPVTPTFRYYFYKTLFILFFMSKQSPITLTFFGTGSHYHAGRNRILF